MAVDEDGDRPAISYRLTFGAGLRVTPRPCLRSDGGSYEYGRFRLL